jgi:hypothetical protein
MLWFLEDFGLVVAVPLFSARAFSKVPPAFPMEVTAPIQARSSPAQMEVNWRHLLYPANQLDTKFSSFDDVVLVVVDEYQLQPLLAVDLRPGKNCHSFQNLVRAFHVTQFRFQAQNLSMEFRPNTLCQTAANVRLPHPLPHPIPKPQC